MSNFVKKTFCLLIFILALGIILSALSAIAAFAEEADTLLSDSGAIKDTDGDGAYEISTKEELIVFCELVNSGKKNINAKLVADIYFNGEEKVLDGTSRVADASKLTKWTPIGNFDNKYSGTFDGAGHTVNGLYLNAIEENGKHVGLFGYISTEGTVKNVCVENSYFGANQYVGGIAGYCEGNIVNCMSSSIVEASSEGSCCAGGIVGFIRYGSLKNCLNTLKVSGKGKNIGGIAGIATGNASIINSHNMGDVLGKSDVGGISGYSEVTPKICYYRAGCAVANAGTSEQVAQGGIGNSADTDGATIKTGVSANAFKNGKIAYLLQGAQKLDRDGKEYRLWGQCLDKNEEYPSFSQDRVYQVGNCGVESFSNTKGEFSHLSLENGICSSCTGYEEAVAVTADNYSSYGLGGEHIGSYAITNKGQLYWFAEKFEYHIDTDISAVMTSDIILYSNILDDSGMLKADENELQSWVAIARGKEYIGTFDGNGHTVKGLYCCETAGFFEKIGIGGKVKDLGITDSYFFVRGKGSVGSIACENEGDIINCYSEATIYNKSYNVNGFIGGIAGTNNGRISRCYNNGYIYISDGNDNCIGGIVGKNEAGATVEICNNVAEINSYTTASNVCGGVVGYSAGNIKYCFNRGNITSSGEEFNEDFDSCVGGIAGVLNEGGEVSKCWNEGTVIGKSQSAGGLVGHIKSGKIDNGYNTGSILGGKYSAGLAGYISGEAEISNSYNIGEIDCDKNIGSKNTISIPKSKGTITNCYYIVSDNSNNRATAISAEKLKNGELLKLLADSEVWMQGENYPEIICNNILIESIALNAIASPVAQNTPQSVAVGENWRGKIVWNCETETFGWNTVYTATIAIIADENYKFSSNISCEGWQVVLNEDGSATATKSFPRTAKRKMDGIVACPDNLILSEHKADADAVISMLPASLRIKLESDGYADSAIIWSCVEYTIVPNATNTFVWSLDPGTVSSYDANGVEISGSVTVTNPDPLPVSHAYRDDRVSYNVGTYDVSRLFIKDANSGEAVYSIAEGGSGSGSLNGSVLTITSSGTIKIKLTTKENGVYAAGEALAYLEVTKGMPEYTLPGELSAYYGQTLGEVEFPEDSKGSWRWDDSSSTPVGDVGTRTFKAIFMPLDSKNFYNSEVYVTICVKKKVIPYPTIANKVFNGVKQTADIEENEYYTVDENQGGISVGAYDVVLTLKDPKNHKWTDIDNKSVTLKFNITKAPNVWITRPTIDGWTYGSAANMPCAQAKFGEISVKYRLYGTEDEYVSSLPTNAGIYEAYFYVEESENYGALSYSVQFVVARVLLTVSADSATKNYGETDPALTWRITSGSLVGNDSLDIVISREKGEAAGEYTITVASGEGGNPNYRITFVGAVFTIEGEDINIAAPTGLKAKYGDTLGDVPLPKGFVWQSPLTTPVGNAGMNIFNVAYIPEGAENDDMITYIPVTIEVLKAEQTITTELTDRNAYCGEILDARYVTAKGKITFESSAPDIASVNEANGKIAVHKTGVVIITVKAGETNNYLSASVSYKLIIDHSYGNGWNFDEADHWKECACGERLDAAIHTFEEGVAVCAVCGKTLALPHEHSYSSEWKYDLQGHWKECECEAKTESAGHVYSETVSEITKIYDADCLNSALYFKSCSVCGHIGSDTFRYGAALGHSFEKYSSDNNAACTADGTKTAKCERCDAKDTVVDVNSALGHSFNNYVSDNNATCTTDGTKTAKCERCDRTDTKTDEDSMTEHDYVDGSCTACGKDDETQTDTTTEISTDTETSDVSDITSDITTDDVTGELSGNITEENGTTEIGSDTQSDLSGGNKDKNKKENSTVALMLAFAAVFAMGVGVSAFVFKKRA